MAKIIDELKEIRERRVGFSYGCALLALNKAAAIRAEFP